MKNKIQNIKREIKIQKEENIRMYNNISCPATDEINCNLWREGVKKINQLTKELNRLESLIIVDNKEQPKEESVKSERYITSRTYENYINKTSKWFMRNA